MSKYKSADDADDLKAGDEENQGKTYKLTIKSQADVTYPPSKWNPESETKPTLFFKETEKRLVLNRPGNKTLRKKYGDESDDWIDKAIYIESITWQNDTQSGWMWDVQALDVEFNDDIPF